MKEYSKPEIIDAQGDVGFAFPALGLAVATGYLVGKAATSVAKSFEVNFSAMTPAGLESVLV